MISRLTNIRTELLADVAVAAIVGTDIFYKNPTRTQTTPYISFIRSSKQEDDVREQDIVQVTCFSSDGIVLEDLADAVKNALTVTDPSNVANLDIGGEGYFQATFILQSDSETKLKNGLFFTILTFELQFAT